jgi:hypothetical protein
MKNNFFKNKYGMDRLSIFIVLISLLTLLNRNTIGIGIVLIVCAIWRANSKNFTARKRESMIFENYLSKINVWLDGIFKKEGFANIKNRIIGFFKNQKERNKYTVTTCPSCAQKLRLPKNKGNIIVKCTNCHNEFKFRT